MYICICIHVYMYICVYICMYIHVYIHTGVRDVYVYMYTCVYIWYTGDGSGPSDRAEEACALLLAVYINQR